MDALMIGISGMRGTVGRTLTPAVAGRMGSAFAAWLKQNKPPVDGKTYRVVFGRDSRPSGFWVRDAAVAALGAAGIQVIDLGIVTTPGVSMMVRHLKADAGMIATASHNPIEWNGLKTLSQDAVALPPADAAEVKRLYEAETTANVEVGSLIQPVSNPDTHALHVKRVLERVDVLGISTKRFKVVIDSVNGAGCVSSATLAGKLGCRLVHLNNTPNGQFPHLPEPTEANLTQLAEKVRRQKADVGFAQDPDADRLAIVDETGRYIGEEYSLVLAARFILSKKPGGIAVANLSTSRMIDDVAAAHGGKVIRTSVGEANVIQAMLAHDAVIGGEGNGGVIDSRIVRGRDSLVGMAYVLQLMADTGKPLSELVAEIPRYEIVKTKFECRREDAERAVEILKLHFTDQRIDIRDGIRIDWPDGWLQARSSNTEPIMRIFAEAPRREIAQARIDEAQRVVNSVLA